MSQISEKRQHSVIFAVTIGNLLEWYEIFLYVYWAPIIAKLFFPSDPENTALIHVFLVFAIGFLARPLGGLFFGRIGDRLGRRKALILSIVMMIFPTFLMSALPTYAQIGGFAPTMVCLLRLIQAFPAGGELPGAFCFLFESSPPFHRRYMTSWGAIGNQVGILLSMIECSLLEHFLTPEALESWGWRLSFFTGGVIGCIGLLFRYKLHETPLFLEIEKHTKAVREGIGRVLFHFKGKILLGMGLCLFNSVGFFLMTILIPTYLYKILGFSYEKNLYVNMLFLLLTTLPLPFLGMLGDRFNNKKMLVYSLLACLLLLYPLYATAEAHSIVFSLILTITLILSFTVLTALLPYRFADLFPTKSRFTCVGVSYNIVDSIAGGFSPVLALTLLDKTGSYAGFFWILFISALISLISSFLFKDQHSVKA